MTGKKLKVDKVWVPMQGGGQEYLTLVYENCFGAGLAYNQMQFIADEINNGRIVLPTPERGMTMKEFQNIIADMANNMWI